MIRLDKDNGLWTITLARPDKANALTYDMLAEIADIAENAQDARALVLTGEGKVFSAGADLDAAKEGLATSDVWDRASSAIAKLPCITIAALNGTLAGGAFGIALACDLRVSVPAANFFYPVMRLGYLPQHADPCTYGGIDGTCARQADFDGGAQDRCGNRASVWLD
jgi:enoyl-CoA hydratase/carnithine racemase